MKRFLRKTKALLLSAALAASALAMPVWASYALGEELSRQDTALHQDAVLSANVFWSSSLSDLRRENFITYTPNEAVTPVVIYGDTLGSKITSAMAAQSLEGQGYRVVAGINGDFYDIGSGQPIGLVIRDGEFLSSDSGYHAIGFRSDGSAVLGKPGIKAQADLGYQTYDEVGYGTQVVVDLAGVNKPRSSTGGIYLYTYDFNEKHTTGTTEPGLDVVCAVEDGRLAVGGAVTLRVERVVPDASATPIQPGQMVLSINNGGSAYFKEVLSAVPEGGVVTVSVSASNEAWNGVDYAVGALYSLLENGQVPDGLPAGAAPRTAVGQKADGSLVFYTIDGRKAGWSIGATLAQVGERMAELGCVTALGLDGGGSTTLTVTTPDATAASTVNSPSEGSLRAVSNHLFLVASNEPSGELDHFYVAPENRYALAGSRVNLTVTAVDTNYIPMEIDYDLDADHGGEIQEGENGVPVLVTPGQETDVTVAASHQRAGGEAVVYVIETPDAITVKNGGTALTALTLAPGGTADLSAGALYRHLPVKADDNVFTWSMDGEAAAVDESGVVTASAPGEATLTVSAGARIVSIPVTVSRMALSTVEDFEDGAPALSPDGYGASLAVTSAPADVRLGRRSGVLDYTLGDTGSALARFQTPLSVSAAYNQLNLWVRGDGSGNALHLQTTDGAVSATTPVCVLDFTDWKQVSVALPVFTGAASITGFSVESETPELSPKGAVYLDQLTASFSGVVDDTAPAVTAAVDEAGVVTARISDDVDGVLPLGAVAVYENGRPVTDGAAYSADGTVVYAPALSEPHEAIRVTVTAKDASGNIGRASVDVAASGVSHHFSDIEGHWAATYIDFLYTAGVTTGYTDGTFRPGQNISRQQFAAMLFRYLGLNAADYEEVALPFADADQIESYALPAARALYAIGVMGGTERDGVLYFNPATPLTRAQAAAMIGRTQEKGLASAGLTFTDAASIPAYAAEHIQTMAAQGIINGYEDGSFKPNANITRGQMAKILYNVA